MEAPNSANTSPSAIASMAPTAQARSDCGPAMVARIAGTVMKGPVPTMFDMLMETALSRPRLRGSLPWAGLATFAGVGVSMLKSKPVSCGLASQNTAIQGRPPRIIVAT